MVGGLAVKPQADQTNQEERLSAAEISLSASSLAHSAGPASVPISQPAGSTRIVVGMPAGAAHDLQVLKHLGVGVGVIGEPVDADLLEPGARLVGIAGIDVDRDHLELRPAELGLQRVERRHLLAAGHAPGGPEIEQHGAPAPVGEVPLGAVGVAEADIGQAQRPLRDHERGDLAARERRDPLGQSRPPAGRRDRPALPWNRPIPYTAASPTATPATPPARTRASRCLAWFRAASTGPVISGETLVDVS